MSMYDKLNTRRFSLKFNTKTDRDIIDCLESVDNFQGFIKKLIRRFISERATKDNDRKHD